MGIGITETEQKIIIDILNNYKKEYCFYFYGSRVKGTFEKTSDLDILIKGKKEMPLFILEEIKEKFDASKLPYIVNFSDYYSIDKNFYNRIENDLFPYDWKEYKLEDICIKITDGSHYSPKPQLEGFPMLSVKDMGEYDFCYTNCKYISIEDYKKMQQNDCVPQKGDILVAKDGSYLKQIFICKETKDEAILSSIAIFRPNTEIVLPRFLSYLLKSPNVYNYIKLNCVSGSALPRIVLKDFKKIELTIPALETQQKIAKVLSAIDDKIELNNKINENLEQQIKILYSNSFNNSDKIVDISSLIDVRDGTHDSPKPQISGKKLITSKHLLKYGVDTISANLISENDYKKINERSQVATNDILISMIGTVGLVSFVIENPVDFCVKNVGIFRTSQVPELIYYIHCFLNSNKTQNYIHSHLAGTTQKYISLSELRTLKIQVPQKNELINFNKLVQPLYNKIINNTQENQNLVQLRDTLLPKLMSGEIDVGKVEI